VQIESLCFKAMLFMLNNRSKHRTNAGPRFNPTA
jgi:hypothetical protein